LQRFPVAPLTKRSKKSAGAIEEKDRFMRQEIPELYRSRVNDRETYSTLSDEGEDVFGHPSEIIGISLVTRAMKVRHGPASTFGANNPMPKKF
jgi:hypothetical protein